MDAYDILGARSLLIGAGRLAAPEPGVSCQLTCSVYQQGDWIGWLRLTVIVPSVLSSDGSDVEDEAPLVLFVLLPMLLLLLSS